MFSCNPAWNSIYGGKMISWILFVMFFTVSLFLGKEMLKKFRFMWNFVKNSSQMVIWHHLGGKNFKPGMFNIVLRGEKPFAVLVGFHLTIPLLKYKGFDYYGFVQSDENGVAVISTYLGKGACEFQFFVNTDLTSNLVVVTSNDEDQRLSPNVFYPPHWYQRLGFYG